MTSTTPAFDFYGRRRDVQTAMAVWESLSPGADGIRLAEFGIDAVTYETLSALSPDKVEGFLNACDRLLAAINKSPERLAALKDAHLERRQRGY